MLPKSQFQATTAIGGASAAHLTRIGAKPITAIPAHSAAITLAGRASDDRFTANPSPQPIHRADELDVRAEDYRVGSKRTFDSFYGTQLEILLRSLDVDTLLVGGCRLLLGLLRLARPTPRTW
jgi:hypothetical protein